MTLLDRRAARHAATKKDIVDAAWALARERGLGGWALRDVAEAVGMRTPSLYGYVASKHALYDAMFADGYEQMLEVIGIAAADVSNRQPPVGEVLRISATLFVDFAVEDPARFQLLFLRTVPGFEPSEAAYALARRVIDRLAGILAGVGADAPEQIDLWTALCTGLAAQQVSNDPGGDRWRRLVDPVVDMFVATQVRSGAAPAPAAGRAAAD